MIEVFLMLLLFAPENTEKLVLESLTLGRTVYRGFSCSVRWMAFDGGG